MPAAWVTGDEIYGNDPDLRRWLEGGGHPHVLAVSCSHAIWHAGKQEPAEVLIAALPAKAWTTLSAGAGSKGERRYDWACIQLPYETAPGMAHWPLARRSLAEPTEIAYFRAWGPDDTTTEQLVRVAGMRWPIEESFEAAKGTVGLDQYEVRRWNAWYRHVTLALLAHVYLEVTRLCANGAKRGEQQTTS